MKLIFKKLPDNLFDKAGQGLLLVSLAAFSAAAAQAQSINDDLQPKKAVVKTTTRRSGTSSKRSTRKQTADSSYSQPARPAPAPAQTPAQVLERYTNYQQSGGVSAADWQSVVAQSSAALQSNPNDVMAKAQLAIGQGQLAYSRADYSNALMEFNTAAQTLPNSAISFYCIGKVYLVTRQPNEAKNNFEKATKLNGTFALAYKGLGDSLAAQGKSKQAQEYFQQAARLGSGTVSQVPSRTASAGNHGNIQRSAQVSPSQISPAEMQIKSAQALTARKKWQDSLNILTPLIRTAPSADLYLAVGDNYFGMRQWLSAQQAYQKAISMNSNSAPALYKMGMVMFQTNEFQGASEAFEKSLILDQNGNTINRQEARQMADKASEKAKEVKSGKKRKFLGIGLG